MDKAGLEFPEPNFNCGLPAIGSDFCYTKKRIINKLHSNDCVKKIKKCLRLYEKIVRCSEPDWEVVDVSAVEAEGQPN